MRVSAKFAMVTAAALAIPGSAGAASTGASSKKMQAATATVSSCGSLSGIGVAWTSTNNVVTSVVLSAIPSACIGATLSVTFVDASNASLGSVGPVTVAGTSQTFSTVTGSPTASSVAQAYAVAVGP